MLVSTKLFVPRPPSRAVARARLFDRLDETGESALTLVSAPVGFGKTALLGSWVRERGQPAAWLSLNEDDNDPGRFWSYLVAALQAVGDDIAESARELLESPQLPPGEAIATVILNDLASASRPVVIVLDDYHVITAEPVHRSLVFLIQHMPPNVRLIVTTRADPPWPLARLRAGGRMTDLRAADLRFTEEEARLFLETAGLSLSEEDIRALERRTEGWVAGLQLAALSMRHRADTSDFIRDFAGSNRFVIDYLAQEVLDRQSETTRSFLVQTSILARLSGDLCDAVTRLGNGQATLEELEQANLFTEPLDDERRWYRYHQLFADVLQSELSQLDGNRLESDLHERASAWFESQGLDEEAVHHALEARDVDRSSRLISRAASATFMVSSQVLVLEWLRRLPGEAIAANPTLALVDAWARFVTGDWEGMVPALEVASQSIGAAGASPEKEALQAQLDGVRSWVAYQMGDLEACVGLARASLKRMPDGGLVPRRIVTTALGYGLLLLGETEAAREVAAETIAMSRPAGDALTECLAIALDAQALLLEGRLEAAARAYERAIAAGTVEGEPLPPVAIARVQLAEVLRERDELEEAEQTLRTSIAACEAALGLPEWVFEGYLTLARVLAARGDVDGSRHATERAESVLEQDLIPGGMESIIERALGYRVRHWLARGEVGPAAAWLRQRGIATDGAVDGSRATLHVLLARTLLAQREYERALQAVRRVSTGANSPVSLAVEAPLVEALVLQAMGREPEATELVADALCVAEPEGYRRLFLDEGLPVMRLLELAAVARPAVADYVARLMQAADARVSDLAKAAPLADGALRGPLNERELQLLRMLSVGRSNRDMAQELYLSVNTVKWHLRNLYAKLRVTRRTLAVARARELGLL